MGPLKTGMSVKVTQELFMDSGMRIKTRLGSSQEAIRLDSSLQRTPL